MSVYRFFPLLAMIVLTLALPACNVVTATVPSVPTPFPAETAVPVPSPVVHVAYMDNISETGFGNLWIVEDGSSPLQLTSGGKDTSPRFSSDGQFVAFDRNVGPGAGVDELWVVHGDGSGAHAIVSQDWLSTIIPGRSTSVYRAEWVPGTHRLAFMLLLISEEPGFELDINLYVVNAEEGALSIAIPPGAPVTSFFYSPNGSRLALASPEVISLVNPDGAGWSDALRYKSKGLGDGAYVPAVDWAPDGSYLRAALPAADLLSPGFTLWNIPADGQAASELGTVADGSFLSYSPAFDHLAFVVRPEGNSNEADLHIADGEGGNDVSYAAGRNFVWQGWAPDSRRFIYSMNGAAYLGEIGLPPKPLFSDVSAASRASWVDDQRILFMSGTNDAPELRLGTPGGSSSVLATPNDSLAQFDFSE